jgi:hypothetical protein
MTLSHSSGMLKKLKAWRRREKLKKLLKDHASEIIIGALVGVLTDLVTDVAQRRLRRVF